MKELLKKIPKIDVLLQNGYVKFMLQKYPYTYVVEALRKAVENFREKILRNEITSFETIDIIKGSEEILRTSFKVLRPVINATGIVLHTNLGRALISDAAVKRLSEISGEYCNLEYDLEKGERGSRYDGITSLLTHLTTAEDALCVNNNAAAVLLAISTIAKGKNVIVSRGELVEIGGGFRVPEVISQSGAVLKEVGTTNKTHLYDYENAIDENTALILHVHTSNYRVVGFTESVPLNELAILAKKHNIPLMSDTGSGILVEHELFKAAGEVTVTQALEAGADIVTFSGDKLLGGPQAGFIAGKSEYIKKMKKNPLLRALRIDKLSIIAAEATLLEYFNESLCIENIPTLAMLGADISLLEHKAKILYSLFNNADLNEYYDFEVCKDYSQAGGGSLPAVNLKTFVIKITPKVMSLNSIEEALKRLDVPIIVRINKNTIILDVRTINENKFSYVVDSFSKIATEGCK